MQFVKSFYFYEVCLLFPSQFSVHFVSALPRWVDVVQLSKDTVVEAQG